MKRPPGERTRAGWPWAIATAIVLVAGTAGGLVGVLARGGDEESAAPLPVAPGTSATVDDEEPPASLPPTVPIAEAADPPEPPEPPVPPEPVGAEEPLAPFPPATVDPGAGTWPEGMSGYTVVLASIPEREGREAAEAVAARAVAAGLDAPGVLRSADFTSLRPGFWVAFAGVYPSSREAVAAAAAAERAGFAGAYVRDVAP